MSGTEIVVVLVISLIANVFALLKHIRYVQSPCCNIKCSITPRKDNGNVNGKDAKESTKAIAKAFMPTSDASQSSS